MSFKSNPNTSYFFKQYEIKTHQMTDKASAMGRRNNLPCGDFWIIGKDFAFSLDFGAGNYKAFSRILEVHKRNIKTISKWYEFKEYLLTMDARCWVTDKTHNHLLYDLGLKP